MRWLSILGLLFSMHQTSVWAATYTLGVVPQQSPLKLYQSWKPVADYLSAKTGHHIVFQTEKSIAEFEQKLYDGAYDFAYMNPYHYVVAHQQQGYQAMIRADKNIQGVVVSTRKTLIPTELAQANFLFPSPNAFAATLLIKYEFLKKYGMDLAQNPHVQYVNSHDSVYKGVARGVGLYGGGVERTFSNYQNDADKSKLHVVYQTETYPSHPIAFRATFPQTDEASVIDALMHMPEALLHNLSIEKVIKTDDAEYDVIRRLSGHLSTSPQ